MKKKNAITLLKAFLFIGAFILVYAYSTKSKSESKLDKISKLSKSVRPLSSQFKDVIDTTLPDTIQIADYSDFNLSSDSIDAGNYKPMVKFLKTKSNMSRPMIGAYIKKFAEVKFNRQRYLKLRDGHELDLVRLTTRFPSNLVLNEYKPKKIN